MDNSDPSTELSELLAALPPAAAVELADPDQPDDAVTESAIVLGVGLGPVAVDRLLVAAGTVGAAAVVLRAPIEPAAAARAGELAVPLYGLPGSVGWHELHRQLLRRLGSPVLADSELAELAQTIATLTGGLVSIEDSTSARVLAYSRSSDEVDELRRLSILGRSGPPEYLALLREWGIYDRLASSEEVLEIAEHPPSGVRRRLAVGVFAGRRQLGTIWVQQGATEFGPQAKQALLGAARLTAPYLLGSTGGRDTRPAGGLREILAGRPDRAADRLGRTARRPCAVAVFVLGDRHRDPAAASLRLDELASIVTVHALAFRRDALADLLDGRLYLLVPNLTEPAAALGMLAAAVSAVRSHLDPRARAVLGTLADEVAGAPDSRRAADLALAVPSTEPVLGFDDARARLITDSIQNHLETQLINHPELLDPRIVALVRDEPVNARTLLDYLDAGCDVVRVAGQLGVHPTTVRHRLRRAENRLRGRLSEPDERLATHLQLRCSLRARPKER
ncbi:MAG TPA: helix-turn-helix domain-containing protein [Jatrophihabitans sp.]|nr:helix-turn-helix domain-containing protein [Jatrophihabitans sp.]